MSHRALYDENPKILTFLSKLITNNVRSSIRLTVSRQIDFKELDKYLKAKPEQKC